MINVVLVDDERPALRELNYLLGRYPEIFIAGMYTDPLKAIEEIKQLKPQVVFIDINMPQLKGIDAASMILEYSPETDIVFVTAFDQYAIKAFELHAMDYILKPVNIERLEKTIERIVKKRHGIVDVKRGEKKLQIQCLGCFQVSWDKQEPIKWRAEKTKEIFAYLLHNRGRDISKDELLDELWPEAETEKAVRQLYNGIYYIRKALEEYGVDKSIISISSNYNLKLGQVDLDIEKFQKFENECFDYDIEGLEILEAYYVGDYMEGEYYSWAEIERERLSNLYLQCLIELSKKYMEEKQWNKAENLLIKAYNKNQYEESITELLMEVYKHTNNKSKAIKHYNSYSNLIKEELNIKPNKRITEVYLSLR